MNVNRREFIVAGVVGITAGAGCGGPEPAAPASSPGSSPPAAPAPAQGPAARKLILDFSGLYGFLFSSTSPLALDVLMIDAAQTSLKSGPPHFARLRTVRENIHSSNPTKETGTQKMSALETRPFWDLKGHRLTIATTGLPPLTKVQSQRGPQTRAPGQDATAQTDLSWLPSMERIVGPGKGRINPACLAPDPSSAKIASRLHFTAGEVSARFRAPFHEVVWRIASPGAEAPIEQAIGELRLTVPVTSETVTFNLEPFAGGPSKQVVLQMKPTGDTLVELIDEPESFTCADADLRKIDHFQAYYELLAPPNASATGPVPTCPDATCKISCATLNSQTAYMPRVLNTHPNREHVTAGAHYRLSARGAVSNASCTALRAFTRPKPYRSLCPAVYTPFARSI